MEKIKYGSIIWLLAAIIVSACGSDTSENSDGSSPHTPGIQNVNGNIPDTGNTINLNSSQPIDSSSLEDSVELNP